MESPAAADGARPRKVSFSQFRRTLTRTFKLAWEASPAAVLTLAALTIVAGVTPAVVVALSRRVVDLVALAINGDATFRQILPWAIGLGLLATSQRISSDVQSNRQYIFSRAVNRYANLLFVRKTAQSELARFDDPSWHDRVQRASRDLNFRPFNLTYQTIGLGGSTVTLIGMLGVLLSLHPLLLVLALVSVAIPIPFERRINREIYALHYELTTEERMEYYLRWLLSDTRPAKDLRGFVLEASLLERHDGLASKHLGLMRRLYRKADLISIGAGLASGLALTAAYIFVASRGASGALSPGDVTALIGAIASVTTQVSSITAALVGIDQHAPFLDDLFDFLEIEPLIQVPDRPTPLPQPLGGGIEFDDVRFSYPGVDEPVLDGLSLRIEDGEMLALVGDNGAGKTTMTKLLLRFYDPDQGAVRIGGVDLRETHPRELRDRIGVLFQDYTNFSLTARENVGFGRVAREANDDAVWAALEGARADEIVKKLPNALDSFVGRMFEGGKDLSGGEWQRLALARLVFREADVWILDEPTSSLDPEAEAQIFAELKEHLEHRIGIVISHRFSTVRIADRIAVVSNGHVTELGTHEELIARGGRYAELFELQAASYR